MVLDTERTCNASMCPPYLVPIRHIRVFLFLIHLYPHVSVDCDVEQFANIYHTILDAHQRSDHHVLDAHLHIHPHISNDSDDEQLDSNAQKRYKKLTA